MSTNDHDFDTIQPTAIPLTQPQPQRGEPRKRLSHKLLVGTGLTAALLLALAVVFVLPNLVKSPEQIAAENASAAPQAPAPVSAKPMESPWRDAQLAKARRAAQDILAKLLERQKYLEKKSVERWAPERYQQGLDTADAADTAFRKRQFDVALASYQQTLAIFTELEQLAGQTLSDTLQAGFNAIDAGDQASARQHFELALALQPNHPEAKRGLERTDKLPAVLAELDRARLAMANAEFETARDHFQAARQLDPDSQPARDGLATANQRMLDRDYIAAISDGYARLEQGDLQGAKRAFGRAVKLKPSDGEAKRALAQAQTRHSRLILQNQLATAAKREREEKWRAAETLYSQILRNDSSVVDARVGQIRTKTRADLDDKLQDLIDNSMRLTSSNVFRDAQQLLDDARTVEPRGARLDQQIKRLKTIMIKASTPWPVEFKSDNATLVTLFRVGDLGKFDFKTLKLKPGRYVAQGKRKGYRDVRLEFHVTGNPSGPIVVQCKEKI